MTFVRTPPALGFVESAFGLTTAGGFSRRLPAGGVPARPVGYETVDVDLDEARRLFWCRLRPEGHHPEAVRPPGRNRARITIRRDASACS